MPLKHHSSGQYAPLACPACFIPKGPAHLGRVRFEDFRGTYGTSVVCIPGRCADCCFMSRCIKFWNQEGIPASSIAGYLKMPLKSIHRVLKKSGQAKHLRKKKYHG